MKNKTTKRNKCKTRKTREIAKKMKVDDSSVARKVVHFNFE